MPRLTPCITTSLAAIAISMTAGCQQKVTHEHVTGTWRGPSHSINSRGKNQTHKVIVLTVDEDGLVEGTSGWELIDGPGGHNGTATSTGDTDQIIGVYDADSGRLHLVEMEEHGHLRGRIIDTTHIEMVLVQAGEKPVASKFTLTRDED